LDSAIKLFNRSLELDSRNAPAYAGLATAYWFKYERLAESALAGLAVENAQRALELDGDSEAALVTMGRVLVGTGEYEQAVVHLDRVVESNPRNGEAFELLARACSSLGRPADAESAFRKAVNLRPSDWTIYKQLGLFYANQSRFDDAIENLRTVTQLSPDNAQGYVNLGVVLYQAGRLDEARQMFEISLGYERRPSALTNLGTLLFEQGDYAKAAEYFREAVERRPTNYQLWGNLGSAYYWSDDDRFRPAFRQAVYLLREALSVNPARNDLYGHIAMYQADLGETDAARAALTRAVADSDHASARDLARIGQVYEILGDRQRAIGFLRKAIAAGFPCNELARMPRFVDLLKSPEWKAVASN
jgi:tetratricopeptide (TPR) repeat protein